MISSEELINKAREAMNLSYAPYSHFTVGAALLCADGMVLQTAPKGLLFSRQYQMAKGNLPLLPSAAA